MNLLSEQPYLGMSFRISANDRDLGVFSECSGLAVDIGSEDYKEGGRNHFVHKLPTHVNTTPVVLKRGLSATTALWDWIKSFVEESIVRPSEVTVELRGPGLIGRLGPVRKTWILDHAYPLKWEGPRLDAMKGEVAFETVELAHRGVWSPS